MDLKLSGKVGSLPGFKIGVTEAVFQAGGKVSWVIIEIVIVREQSRNQPFVVFVVMWIGNIVHFKLILRAFAIVSAFSVSEYAMVVCPLSVGMGDPETSG
ncbi:hypothetical protein TNIN_256041 [Trichonephila inaurata madagascariensis]|uniref:Uncharacterized protein n=1 Tax=Trichonephila inaurata madagascariensis TaxID=2747483 RepID=A0A8X6IYM3_9ARAC|nr:hypothetical protein TNIN_256041 [Trichonephila inaurata madagascariensis]